MNSVVHFEMPNQDPKRVSDFYSNVFGWKMTMSGPEMGNYIMATTTESGDKGPKNPGAINGGFFTKSENNAHPSVVIAVEDIKAHIEKVTQAGGNVLGEPIEIPHVGWYVSFEDTEGNRVSLLQPTVM